MPDDDRTEVAPRHSPSATTSVRLFNGLGGVELGVRHTGQKAMLFVRFRKLVIAGWWKAPGTGGKTPIDLAVERADERRAAAGVASARPEVQPGDDPGIASLTTSASAVHATGITESRAIRPETPAAETTVAGPEIPAVPAEDQNVMHRLWSRFSASFRKGRSDG